MGCRYGKLGFPAVHSGSESGNEKWFLFPWCGLMDHSSVSLENAGVSSGVLNVASATLWKAPYPISSLAVQSRA